MRMENGFIPFEIEALTPIHIGSGEDFSPLEYTIRQNGESEFEAVLIDTASWLSDCGGEPEIACALDTGDMPALRALLNAASNAEKFALARIPVSSFSLGKELFKKRNTIENRAEIMAFARNPFTHTPFIPASSLKGAINTAIMDYLNEQRRGHAAMLRDKSADPGRILEEMYGKTASHAMKALRIGDIPLPPGMTSIMGATGFHLDPGERLAKTHCEALNPAAVNSFVIAGSLRMTDAASLPAITFPDGRRIAASDLGRICNEFYCKRFKAEYEKFYTKPHFQPVKKNLEALAGRIDKLDGKNEILLRVGRYSHIECVTISGSPPPKKKGYGKTRTLADSQIPFGWILLKRCGMDKYADCQKRVAAATEKNMKAGSAIKAGPDPEREEYRARKLKEEEAARVREEMLAAMTPAERSIWELEQEGATENRASALYASLQEMGDLQLKAAAALMRFWQKLGKWEGKSLTKKQKEKVAAVRSILEQMRE